MPASERRTIAGETRKFMMNIESHFDVDKMVRIHRVSGVVSLSEFHEILRTLYTSPNFNPDMNALWDIRQADFSKVTPDDVRALMQVVATHWGKDGKCRAAIVVAGMAEYGISRMYESQVRTRRPARSRSFSTWSWRGSGLARARKS